jgi:hypothetical protein
MKIHNDAAYQIDEDKLTQLVESENDRVIQQAKKLVAKRCRLLQKPIKQVTGTCWFNSVINGMMAGERFQQILFCKYVDEVFQKARVRRVPNKSNACPINVTKEGFIEKLVDLYNQTQNIDLDNNVYKQKLKRLI